MTKKLFGVEIADTDYKRMQVAAGTHLLAVKSKLVGEGPGCYYLISCLFFGEPEALRIGAENQALFGRGSEPGLKLIENPVSRDWTGGGYHTSRATTRELGIPRGSAEKMRGYDTTDGGRAVELNELCAYLAR